MYEDEKIQKEHEGTEQAGHRQLDQIERRFQEIQRVIRGADDPCASCDENPTEPNTIQHPTQQNPMVSHT